MATIDVHVLTHGYCFDGLASAALFTAFLRRFRMGPAKSPTFRYQSLGYSPTMNQVPSEWFRGRENAILDFRYTKSPKLTWYFDHHRTAFSNASEEKQAMDRASSQAGERRRMFYDASYGSCTKLIADVGRDWFGIEMPELAPLVSWADTIDAARFGSAQEALSDAEPAMQIARVVEHHGDTALLHTVVPLLCELSLEEVAAHGSIAPLFEPIRQAREKFLVDLEKTAKIVGNVAIIDRSTAVGDHESGVKFAPYALFPETQYSVSLSRGKKQWKLSVGYNPWCGSPRNHDISEICKRYGGGGHPVVGGASFALDDLELAQGAARTIAEELSR